MGGVDDCDSLPPSKRLKCLALILAEEPSPSLLSFNPSMARSIYHIKSFSSSSSSLKPSSLSSSSSLPCVHVEIEETLLGNNGLIRKTIFLIVIRQSLYSLGYCKSVSFLEQESHQVEHIWQCCPVSEPFS